MRQSLLVFGPCLVVLVSSTGLAANVCVGPAATGAGDGSDWNNIAQWSSSAFARGSTYYLQTGAYGSKTLDTAESGSTYVLIKKATASAHGADAGWQGAYGTGSADFVNGASLTVATSYWDIDGVTGGGPGNWQTGHGITFNNAAGTAVDWINVPKDPLSNLNLRHCRFTQTGDTTKNAQFANVVYQVGPVGLSHSTFEYLFVDNISGLPFFMRFGMGDVFQYNYLGKVCGASAFDVDQHCEVLVHWGMSDVHFRYNYVEHTPSSGGLIKNDAEHGKPGHVSDSFRIYGNVFEGRNDGVPISCNDGECTNWTIINNTFHDNSGGPFTNGGAYSVTNLIGYNNIVFNAWDMVTYFAPYDWYSRLNGSPNDTSCQTGADSTQNVCVGCASGCDTVKETLDPFVNSSGHLFEDFSLSGPMASWPGFDVCASVVTCDSTSTYDLDALGNRRGADGVWDRGAIEFVSDAALDAGVRDASSPAIDAAVPGADARAPAEDAAAAWWPDAARSDAVAPDSMAPGADAAPLDAANLPDSGTPSADAGPAQVTNSCSCGATAAPLGGWLAWAALVTLLARRRPTSLTEDFHWNRCEQLHQRSIRRRPYRTATSQLATPGSGGTCSPL
jgi:MYXO-CTERM domain-containing protein